MAFSASKIFGMGRIAFADCDLTFFVLKILEIFHVHVEEARANFFDGLNNVGAGTCAVANVDAAADARIHCLHRV